MDGRVLLDDQMPIWGARRGVSVRNAELVADRLVVQSGSNHSGHRAADLAPWHSSVVQMSASPRVIRPRAWPDWSLHSARSTARCLSGVSGAGREPDAARESARARRHAIKMKIKMKGAPMAIKMKFCHFDFSICAANSDSLFAVSRLQYNYEGIPQNSSRTASSCRFWSLFGSR